MRQSRILGVILVMQGLTLAGQWLGSPSLPAAHAQIPDAGAQRAQILDEMKSLNGKMDRLITILDGGKLQVTLAKPDESK